MFRYTFLAVALPTHALRHELFLRPDQGARTRRTPSLFRDLYSARSLILFCWGAR